MTSRRRDHDEACKCASLLDLNSTYTHQLKLKDVDPELLELLFGSPPPNREGNNRMSSTTIENGEITADVATRNTPAGTILVLREKGGTPRALTAKPGALARSKGARGSYLDIEWLKGHESQIDGTYDPDRFEIAPFQLGDEVEVVMANSIEDGWRGVVTEIPAKNGDDCRVTIDGKSYFIDGRSFAYSYNFDNLKAKPAPEFKVGDIVVITLGHEDFIGKRFPVKRASNAWFNLSLSDAVIDGRTDLGGRSHDFFWPTEGLRRFNPETDFQVGDIVTGYNDAEGVVTDVSREWAGGDITIQWRKGRHHAGRTLGARRARLTLVGHEEPANELIEELVEELTDEPTEAVEKDAFAVGDRVFWHGPYEGEDRVPANREVNSGTVTAIVCGEFRVKFDKIERPMVYPANTLRPLHDKAGDPVDSIVYVTGNLDECPHDFEEGQEVRVMEDDLLLDGTYFVDPVDGDGGEGGWVLADDLDIEPPAKVAEPEFKVGDKVRFTGYFESRGEFGGKPGVVVKVDSDHTIYVQVPDLKWTVAPELGEGVGAFGRSDLIHRSELVVGDVITSMKEVGDLPLGTTLVNSGYVESPIAKVQGGLARLNPYTPKGYDHCLSTWVPTSWVEDNKLTITHIPGESA